MRPSSIKKFIKYPSLTFQVLKPMRAPVNFNGAKNWQKLLDFVKFGKKSCFNFCKKENMKPSPGGPLLTCSHTNKQSGFDFGSN